MSRVEHLAEGVTLYLGDCRGILPTLGKTGHVIGDPPYEAVMQDKWGALSRNAPSSHVRYEALTFGSIDDIRSEVALRACQVSAGWLIFFCMAEGVRAWRDALEAAGARYKRAMVWHKPDAMPQFNGQGPSVGFEMMVAAWCGEGHSRWNGHGRPGTFTHNKNTPGGSEHETQKPLPLMKELVELFTSPGETICDPFMGSGTTGIAAVKLGRKFTGIEIQTRHFDIACRRISEALKQPDLFIESPKPLKQEAMAL